MQRLVRSFLDFFHLMEGGGGDACAKENTDAAVSRLP